MQFHYVSRLLVTVPWIAISVACGPIAPDRPSEATLIYLAEDVPAGLDYDGPAAALPTSQTGMVNLMEPLIGYAYGDENEDGVALPDFETFAPRLSESWRYNEARRSWVFKLREGVFSCAGNELTADDVVYTFARGKSVSGAIPVGWFLASTAGVSGFDASVFEDEAARVIGDAVRRVDRYTVEIRVSGRNALFLPIMTTYGMLIFDSKETQKHATDDDPWAHDYVNNVTAPGFGPYCLERWAKNDMFVMRANENYYRGAPALKRVVIKRIPQSSNRFILVKSGEADMAERLTPREFSALADVDGARVAGVVGNETLFLHMNFKTPPFDNLKFREAIARALPTEKIIRNGYFGEARAWRGVTPSTYPGFVDALDEDYYDPDAARRLLAEAGFPEGEGLRGFQESLRLAYVAEKEATLGPIATMLQTALREIGVPVELDPIPLTQYGDRQLVKKDLPFALNDQEKPVVVDAGYALSLFFASPDAGGINNMVNVADPSVDAAALAAASLPAGEERAARIADGQRRLAEIVAWAPVVEYRTQWAVRDHVSGLTWHPDNAVRFADLEIAR